MLTNTTPKSRALIIVGHSSLSRRQRSTETSTCKLADRTAAIRAHLERVDGDPCTDMVVYISGTRDPSNHHSSLTDALDRLRAGDFSVVALESPDRLSRTFDTWARVCHAAAEGGASLLLTRMPGVCLLSPSDDMAAAGMMMALTVSFHAAMRAEQMRQYIKLRRATRGETRPPTPQRE